LIPLSETRLFKGYADYMVLIYRNSFPRKLEFRESRCQLIQPFLETSPSAGWQRRTPEDQRLSQTIVQIRETI
jgi:hypothetical protein